jgi:hypothetical protein
VSSAHTVAIRRQLTYLKSRFSEHIAKLPVAHFARSTQIRTNMFDSALAPQRNAQHDIHRL